MRHRFFWPALFSILVLLVPPAAARQAAPKRNVIIFVADGLRHGSVNATDTPALWSIRTNGVDFADSYSVFPTFTTANASAIATGHGLGDTGDFSNTIWTGFATFDTGAFGLAPGTPVPFIENDRIIADLDAHFGGNFLGKETFLSLARAAGYQTASIGKIGPAAIQDASTLAPADGNFPAASPGLVIDDGTGSPAAPPVPLPVVTEMLNAGVALEAPTRSNGYGATSQYNNGYAGDRSHAGTLAANVVQQQWFADVTTKAVLPAFTAGDKPFAIVFWSRDPDGTQHNQGDSLGALSPGINFDTTKRALMNVDRNLQQLLAWLDAHPSVKANTDVLITSDHGFATISRRELDRTGQPSNTEASRHSYVDASGKIDTVKGTLPNGFLAIDLASAMQTSLFDPDQHADGSRVYKKLHIELDGDTWEHPAFGNGLIGGDVQKPDGSDAVAIVAANGGSDLIYVPNRRREVVDRIVSLLMTFDYVGGVFVDDELGPVPGTLPLGAIGLVGDAKTPRPTIVVSFKAFRLNPDDLQSAVQVSDTALQTGQGMHGGFGRESTFNNMAAIGPDFKTRFVDRAPVGNIDILPTLARAIGLPWKPTGWLTGRAAVEALAGSPAASEPPLQVLRSPAAGDKQTVLLFRELSGVRYLQAACIVSPATPERDACK